MLTLLAVATELAQAVPQPDDVLKAWWTTAVSYAFTALLAYVAASMRFGKKLREHDEGMRKHIGSVLQPINTQLDRISVEQMRMSAEVWGPQMNTGMRQELNAIRGSVETLATQMATVVAIVKNLRPHED